MRGRAGLDKRANMNGRGILRRMGRASLCPPLELARALQEEEGGERGRVGGREGGRTKEEGRYHIVKASLARAWFLSVERNSGINCEEVARESATPEYIVWKSRAGAGVLTKLRGSLKRERRS